LQATAAVMVAVVLLLLLLLLQVVSLMFVGSAKIFGSVGHGAGIMASTVAATVLHAAAMLGG
jgi:hypothetical protein